MTPFPGRAGAGAHPTVTRRPPFFRTVDAPGLLPDSGGGIAGQEIISMQPADAPGLRRRSFRRLRRSRTAIDRARSAAEGSSVLVVEDLDLDHPVHHGQDRQ